MKTRPPVRLLVPLVIALGISACTEPTPQIVDRADSEQSSAQTEQQQEGVRRESPATAEGEASTQVSGPASTGDDEAGGSSLPVATLGDTIEVGDLRIVVHGVRRTTENLFAPDAGNVLLIVEATFENLSDEEESISAAFEMDVRDPDGRVYDFAIADLPNQLSGTILPRGRIRGEVAFEVPEAATDFIFVFDPFLSGRPVVVTLPNEDTFVDPG